MCRFSSAPTPIPCLLYSKLYPPSFDGGFARVGPAMKCAHLLGTYESHFTVLPGGGGTEWNVNMAET